MLLILFLSFKIFFTKIQHLCVLLLADISPIFFISFLLDYSYGVIAGGIMAIIVIISVVIAVVVICCKRRQDANNAGKETVPLKHV